VKRNEVNDTTPDRPESPEVATISLFLYMLSPITNSDVTVNFKEREGEVRVREEKKGCQGRKKKYPIETIDHVVPGVKYRTLIYLFFILCPD